MFNAVSMAGTGVIVTIVTSVLAWFGITPEDGTVLDVVNSVIIVVGWVMIIVGQIRRGDLKLGLLRKS